MLTNECCPKKGNAKKSSNYHTIALISHASKVMLKILQARLQQYVNHEFPDVQAGCVDPNKLWKILKEMGISDHLTCLLTNLYAGHEATVRTEHGTTGWFQIGKGVRQGSILSPCLFNCRVHHEKCWTGGSTSWNRDCQEKYQ